MFRWVDTRLLKEMWVKKKGPGNFFFEIFWGGPTDYENSFPKIRADPSWELWPF